MDRWVYFTNYPRWAVQSVMKAIRMRLAPIVAFTATVCAATPATAERYAILKVSMEDRALVALNLDSLRQVNGKWRAWVVTGMVVPQHEGPVLVQSLAEFDCAEERSRTIDNKLYDEKLNMIGEMGGKDWNFAAPNTTGYDTIQVACKTKKGEEFGVENETIESLMETFAFGIKRQQLKK